jgi:GNAT superfamily N-acetyltransferase
MEILPYQSTDFDRVVAFLRENWAGSHPLYDRALFDWQYRTATASASLLVVDEGRVVGFLGTMPGRYVLDGEVRAAAGLTMWCVDRELRSGGLGVRLIRATEKTHPVTFTLGANVAVLPMYLAMGYAVLPSLHRYSTPLDNAGCARLGGQGTAEVRPWPIGILPTPDAQALSDLFGRTVRPAFRFTQVRDADFWSWRYIENTGYRYHRFGEGMSGAVVARVEPVHAPDRPDVHGLRVLRLIELLPSTPAAWDGPADDRFSALLGNVLGWAKTQGCVAADFQCASSRAGHLLRPLGFGDRDEIRLPELLSPFRPDAAPINFVWKVSPAVDADDCYVVKSDCDMDRPSLWPLPAHQPWRVAC